MGENSENPSAYISEKWGSTYEALCKGEHSIYEKMTTLFTLCADIGYLNDERSALEKKKDIFKWFTLDSEGEVPVLTAIAWNAKNRDLGVLSDRKEIITISSEFAEAGMQYLYNEYFNEFVDDGHFLRPDKVNVFEIAQIVEGLRQKQNIFE